MSDNSLGDLGIYSYKYKGQVYREYVMWRRNFSDISRLGWHTGQGQEVDADRVQSLPSAERMHDQLDLADPLAYTPKRGDVGTYRTASGTVITVQYRLSDRFPFAEPDWYQYNGVQASAAHEDKSFKLLVRDGEPVKDEN